MDRSMFKNSQNRVLFVEHFLKWTTNSLFINLSRTVVTDFPSDGIVYPFN